MSELTPPREASPLKKGAGRLSLAAILGAAAGTAAEGYAPGTGPAATALTMALLGIFGKFLRDRGVGTVLV